MANVLLTPDVIAREAVMVLVNNLVAAGLVYRSFTSEFAKIGDTVTVRKPTTFIANDFVEGSNITLQNATETGVTLKLDKFKDVSFSATSKDLALNINDFSLQFVQPAMRALAQQIDSDVLAIANDFPDTYVRGATPVIGDFAQVGKIMNDNKVPTDSRYGVLNTDHFADYISLENIVRVDASGTNDALRRALLGDVLGFETYMSQNMPQSTTGKDQSLFFHGNAISLVSAPLDTQGSEFNASQSYAGVTIRVAQDYDIKTKTNIYSFDCLYGIQILDENLGVRLVSA